MSSLSGPIDLLEPAAFREFFALPEREAFLLDLLNSVLKEGPRLAALAPWPFSPPPESTKIPPPVLSLEGRDAEGGRRVVLCLLYREFLPGMENQLLWLASKAVVEDMERRRTRVRVTPTAVVAVCGGTGFPPEAPLLSSFGPREEQTGVSGYSFMPMEISCLDLSRYRAGESPAAPEERWAYAFLALARGEAVPDSFWPTRGC